MKANWSEFGGGFQCVTGNAMMLHDAAAPLYSCTKGRS